MSGGTLRLQVVLQALDKASGPFRKIASSSKGLAGSLRKQQETLRKLNAAQRDISALRQQRQAIEATSMAQRQAQERVRELARQVAATATPTRKLAAELNKAKLAAKALKAEHRQQGQTLQRLRTGLLAAGINTRDLGSHQRRLQSDIVATTRKIELQRQRLAALDRANEGARRLHSAGMKVAGHGVGAAATAGGAVRSLALPIRHAMAFESAMADVKKVVNFQTPEQFRQMARDVEDLALHLPMIPADIARIVAAAGQASIPREELLRFAEDAAKMGVAFDTTAEDAGQTMATWRTAFRMGQDQVVLLADKINHLGNTGPANVAKISEVVNRIGALGEVAGLESGSLAALGATVAGMGIESEVSATGIKNMLLTLSAGASATRRQQATFEALGLSAKDMAETMRGDASGAILSVLERLKQLPEHEQAASMTSLFGRESIGAIAPLLTNLDLLRGNLDKVADAQRYGGSMNAEYASRVTTTGNALQLLRNSALVASESVGDTLLPDTKALSDWTARVLARFTEWVRANPKLAARMAKCAIAASVATVVIGGLVTALGLGMMVIAQVGKVIARMTGGRGLGGLARGVVQLAGRALPMLFNAGRMLLPVLGGLSAPMLLIGAAVLAVALLVWKYWKPIKAFMVGVWDGIAEVARPAMDALMAALEPLGPVWDMVSGAVGKAWAWFKKLLMPFEATSEQLQGAMDAGKGFGSVLGGVLAGGLRKAASVITTLIGAFKIILPILKSVFGGAWQYLQGVWDTIVGLFTGDGDRIRKGLSSMWEGINKILMGWPEKMMQAGRDMLAGLCSGIIANAFVVREAIAGVASSAMDRFKELLGINSPSRVFAQYGDFTMQGLAGGLQRSQSAPLQQVSGLGERMKQLGSGLALSAAIPVAAATPVMTPGTIAAGTAGAASVSYTININAPAGSDAQDIARLVREAVAQIERDRTRRHASRLTD